MIMIIFRSATVADIPAIARVHVDTWRSTYRGIIPAEYLASLSYDDRADRWHRILTNPANAYFVYVAEDNAGQIVGFASGGTERTGNAVYQGELTAIYILDSYQKQGIGKRLVQLVAENLCQKGINSMLIWVLLDNPACQFYAALGGQKVDEKEIEIGGIKLIEVAYSWTDTAIICDE
jgi:GNAT superfamily N-acetyltransferase